MKEEGAEAPILVQRASAADAVSIAQVLLEAFREFEPLYTPAAFRATTPRSAEIEGRFAEGPLWTATDGTSVVGTVSALVRGEETHLRSMAVLPIARGRGLASRLLDAVHAHAIGEGSRRLTLCTTPFLAAAIRLYEGAGFRRLDEPLDLHGTPLIAMVKDLISETAPGGHGAPQRRTTS